MKLYAGNVDVHVTFIVHVRNDPYMSESWKFKWQLINCILIMHSNK